MTHNIFVKCEVCGSVIDLKWQVGYLPKSIFRVSCGKCKSSIEGILKTDDTPSFSYEIIKGNEIEASLEIECDYIIPISGEIITEKMRSGKAKYRPTPFLNVISLVEVEKFSEFNQRISKGLLKIEKYKDKCDRINELYFNKQYKYLKKMLKEDFDISMKKNNINKIIEEKYGVDFSFFNFFRNQILLTKLEEKIYKTYRKLKATNKCEYEKLLDFVKTDIDKFEKRIRDSLNIFINNYNFFVPVLLLEYMDEKNKMKVLNQYAITTVHFEDVRDLYLRIYENIIEVSTIFVGLNNILYRGDYEKINEEIIKGKRIIKQYIELSKGKKMKYLRVKEDFNLIIPNFDTDIRNAIGHEDIEYNIFDQKLVYKGGQSYLIQYVYNIWECYEFCTIIYRIVTDMKLDILRKFK